MTFGSTDMSFSNSALYHEQPNKLRGLTVCLSIVCLWDPLSDHTLTLEAFKQTTATQRMNHCTVAH